MAQSETKLQSLKEKEEEKIKAKCMEIFELAFTCYFRTGILNSYSRFRLGWEIALCPLEERVVFGLDAYDILNKVEVGNYD